MTNERDLLEAAELFKALSAASRLRILCALSAGPSTVTALAGAAGLSQPLVSQHLKLLRGNNLVSVTRLGKEALYALADGHVSHMVADALAHIQETRRGNHMVGVSGRAIMTEENKAEHTLEEHRHGGADCTHESVRHGDHVDYLHDGHRHAEHEDHYDEHDDPAEHTPGEHRHGGADCTHESVQHGDHVDYLHDGHRHAEHEDHYDEH